VSSWTAFLLQGSQCRQSKVNESHNNPKRRNSKHKDNVTHTTSLVRVLFEDFGVAISIHKNAKDIHNTHPIPPLILLNDGFNFEGGIVANKEYNQLEKECLKSIGSLCVFGYRKYYKKFAVHLGGILLPYIWLGHPCPKTYDGDL
jgi:hypothetical protein